MKKTIYITLSVILGTILSFLAHALIEKWYLSWAQNNNHQIIWVSAFGKGLCALPFWLNYGLLIIGVIGGYFLGKIWWRVVYIEKRHWRFKNKNL
ncbi:hypothetical protein KJ840_05580 [Patescibacteria group bacterium]|nr:hypothetical protein [Patescibacteria group bacterium]